MLKSIQTLPIKYHIIRPQGKFYFVKITHLHSKKSYRLIITPIVGSNITRSAHMKSYLVIIGPQFTWQDFQNLN